MPVRRQRLLGWIKKVCVFVYPHTNQKKNWFSDSTIKIGLKANWGLKVTQMW